jgi:hypothetical protein
MIWRDTPVSGHNGQDIWAGRTANQAIPPKMGEMGTPLWNEAMVQSAALFAAALP